MRGISKAYPGVQALDKVDFQCEAGEIHGLLGANGSGKSTLVGIASGVVVPDTGTIEINGEGLKFADPAAARSVGLGTVYQDTSLILEQSVAQNLFLSALPDQRPRYSQMRDWARGKIKDFELTMDADALVADLSIGMRQILEVIKAMICRPKVIFFDEPTSALGPPEVAFLHRLIRLAAAGGTAVMYVSHRLSEVLDVADRITVLRDGQFRGTFLTEGLTPDRVIELMVGNRLEMEFPPKRMPEYGKVQVALSAEDLDGRGRFGPVSLQLYVGEILGVVGAEGNGQREILRSLAGSETASGQVSLNGQPLSLNSVERMLDAGIILLSGDRERDSLFSVLGIRENMGVHVLENHSKWGVVADNRERLATMDLVDRLGIVTPSIELAVRFLSGGNQQKVVMSRAFSYPARVILVDEPTRGVDAKARLDIYSVLRSKAEEGISVFVNSSDPHELAGLCDRVLVVSRGQIVRELSGTNLTEKNIVSALVTSKDKTPKHEAVAGGTAEIKEGAEHFHRFLQSDWMPLAAILALMTIIGGYTFTQSSRFLSVLNFHHLFRQTIPLALVGMAQLNVLLVGGFDISVGSLMSITVVLASFLIVGANPPLILFGGAMICLVAGLSVGFGNGMLVRGLRITPVIATIATLSILQGIALYLRPRPAGPVSREFLSILTMHYGLLPWAFLLVVGGAVFADLWLYRSAGGLATRAVGFREEAARRVGIHSRRVHIRAYLLSGLVTAIAGLFLASEVGIGMPTAGTDYTLKSIAVAVLGGASLFGGRGSFIGCFLGALFLSLSINIIPFLGITSAFAIIMTGVVTLLAILLYSGKRSLKWVLAGIRKVRA